MSNKMNFLYKINIKTFSSQKEIKCFNYNKRIEETIKKSKTEVTSSEVIKPKKG